MDAGGTLLEQLGYDREALVGLRLTEVVDDDRVLGLVRRGLEGESVVETALLRGRRWMVAVRPASDAHGAPSGCICVLTFADQVEVHQQLTAREADLERFAALVELSKDFARLSEAGICLLVDDFGTGYSSLSYLERFPVVDVLKVDRSFLLEGTRGRAVVQAVVGLARAFGFDVCAEGVETPEQLGFLRDLGCDLAQGFYLARPVPADDIVSMLAAWTVPA